MDDNKTLAVEVETIGEVEVIKVWGLTLIRPAPGASMVTLEVFEATEHNLLGGVVFTEDAYAEEVLDDLEDDGAVME